MMWQNLLHQRVHNTKLRGSLIYALIVCTFLCQACECTGANDSAPSLANQPIDRSFQGEGKMKNQPIPKKIVTDKSTISTDFRFIHRITWSPDSQYFAVTQTTRTTVSVIVYDAKTHRIVKDLSVEKCGPYPGDQEFISEGDVAFSPDGRYLAGGVGIITLWDTKTWQPVRNILGPFSRGSNAAAAVRNIAFSPDSRSLAIFYRSVTWPETIRVDRIDPAIAKDKSIKHPGTIMVFDSTFIDYGFFYRYF